MKNLVNKPVIRNAWGFTAIPSDFEKNSGVSETVPDLDLSISEILMNFTRGMAPVNVKEEQYDDDANFDNIDITQIQDFDLTDLQEMRQNAENDLKALDEAIQKKAREDQSAMDQAADEAEAKRKAEEAAQITNAE